MTSTIEECPICLDTYTLDEVLKCSNGHTSACGYCLSRVVNDNCSICRTPTMTDDTSTLSDQNDSDDGEDIFFGSDSDIDIDSDDEFMNSIFG